MYEYLEKDKENIEEEIGSNLEWNNKSKHSSKISLNYNKFNPKHEELWPYCIKWHVDTIKIFYNTFNSRIKEFEK